MCKNWWTNKVIDLIYQNFYFNWIDSFIIIPIKRLAKIQFFLYDFLYAFSHKYICMYLKVIMH